MPHRAGRDAEEFRTHGFGSLFNARQQHLAHAVELRGQRITFRGGQHGQALVEQFFEVRA